MVADILSVVNKELLICSLLSLEFLGDLHAPVLDVTLNHFRFCFKLPIDLVKLDGLLVHLNLAVFG